MHAGDQIKRKQIFRTFEPLKTDMCLSMEIAESLDFLKYNSMKLYRIQ